MCDALDATVCLFWGMEGNLGHIVQTHDDSGAEAATTAQQVQAAREVRPLATKAPGEGTESS